MSRCWKNRLSGYSRSRATPILTAGAFSPTGGKVAAAASRERPKMIVFPPGYSYALGEAPR